MMEVHLTCEGREAAAVSLPDGCTFKAFQEVVTAALELRPGTWECAVQGEVLALAADEEVTGALAGAMAGEVRLRGWYAARLRLRDQYGEPVPLGVEGEGVEEEQEEQEDEENEEELGSDDDAAGRRAPAAMLADAMRLGDVERLSCVLAAGICSAPVLLHAASASGPRAEYPARLQQLLDAGIDPNLSCVSSRLTTRRMMNRRREKHCAHILVQAIVGGAMDAATALLARGADPNAVGGGTARTTALMAAAAVPAPAVVQALLEHGADAAAVDARGQVALCYLPRFSAEAGAVLDALLAHGADINHRDAKGCTPLMDKISAEDLPGARALLDRGADPNTAMVTLCLSCRPSHALDLEFAKALLEGGADPNLAGALPRTSKGRAHEKATPLGLAITRLKNLDLVRLLLAYKADPNAPSSGRALLDLAVGAFPSNDPEGLRDQFVQVLQEAGAVCAEVEDVAPTAERTKPAPVGKAPASRLRE